MASIISAGTTSGTSLNLSGDTSGVLQLATNGSTTAVTITTAQNVGIGTTSPTFAAGGGLQVKGSGFTSVRLTSASSTGVDFSQDTSSNGYMYNRDNAALIYGTNNTERMRIDSVGRVGIGNSSPSALLHVTNNSNTYAGGILIGSAGVASGYISTTDNLYIKPNTTANTASGVVVVQDFSNANKITLSSVNGTIGLGGANAASTGVGITFPATQSASSDANTLDDYEEGTWTPTVKGTSTAGTGTYGAQNGFYTKIGNRILFQCYVQWSNLTGAAGFLALGGLPFTSNSSSGSYAALSTWNSNIALTANNVLLAYVNPNSSDVTLVQYPVGGGSDTNIAIDTAGSIMVAGHYFV